MEPWDLAILIIFTIKCTYKMSCLSIMNINISVCQNRNIQVLRPECTTQSVNITSAISSGICERFKAP